jgi:hypothetical protein
MSSEEDRGVGRQHSSRGGLQNQANGCLADREQVDQHDSKGILRGGTSVPADNAGHHLEVLTMLGAANTRQRGAKRSCTYWAKACT